MARHEQSGTFTATGVSASIAIKHGDFLSYAVSGTFAATLVVEKSVNGGASWEQTFSSVTAAASVNLPVELPGGGQALFRFRCTSFTSGTVAYTIGEGERVIKDFVDTNGEVVVRVSEDGMRVYDARSRAVKFSFLRDADGVVTRTAQKRIFPAPAHARVGAVAGWRGAQGPSAFRDVTCTTTFPNCTLLSTLAEDGDSADFAITGLMGGAATSATELRITLPAGYVIDADKMTADENQIPLGSARLFDSGTGVHYGVMRVASTTTVDVEVAGAAVTETAPFTWASPDRFGLRFKVPIVALANVNTSLVTLPASRTAATLIIPIEGLKVGDVITSFHLIGQIEAAGNTVTVDASLRKHTAAAADVADAEVGAITQLSVIADTIMSATNTSPTALSETVGADETFYILITATTGAACDIALQGVAVTVTES